MNLINHFKAHALSLVALAVVLYSFTTLAFAQTARKPSFYENRAQELLLPVPPTTPIQVKSQVKWLNTIKNRDEFDQFARIYNPDTPFEIPHILFTVDLTSNQIYFINTPKFALHEQFIAALIGRPLSKSELDKNYYNPDRNYIFGTLSWQTKPQLFTYEFWEGDRITPLLLNRVQKELDKHFFENTQFKTNSTWHEQVAQSAAVPYITQADLIQEQPFMALNVGQAKGRLIVIEKDEDLDQVTERDILLLIDVPLTLPPVAGVITEKPSTLLSHVNLLTKGWGVPNIYLKDARKILAPLINSPISLQVTFHSYTIEPISPTLIEKEQPQTVAVTPKNIPQPNLTDTKVKTLAQLHVKDSIYCGAKAANLGEVKASIARVNVPDGFCIPFAYYHQFMQQHQLQEKLEQLYALPDFHTSVRVRRETLEAFRESMMQLPLNSDLLNNWVQQWSRQLNGSGVFVRSSSNSEDLPNFSGAGLYTTTPNVMSPEALELAIKRSWASIYNFEAYEARRVANIPHHQVFMSVLIQTAINADASGVLVTLDPFNPTHKNSTYIVAKRGVGMPVVEGKKIAEQVLYSHHSKAIQVLSHSEETTALQLDENGGVIEVIIGSKRQVLSDELIIQLAEIGLKIKQLYKGVDQDIEWAIEDGKVIILQTRPFIQN